MYQPGENNDPKVMLTFLVCNDGMVRTTDGEDLFHSRNLNGPDALFFLRPIADSFQLSKLSTDESRPAT